MRGFIIFDSLNDIIFKKFDVHLLKHITDVSVKNGLLQELPDQTGNFCEAITNDVLIQLFSPVVTSQRVMKERMQNSYNSVYCKDQTLCVFTEVWKLMISATLVYVDWRYCIGCSSKNFLRRMNQSSIENT